MGTVATPRPVPSSIGEVIDKMDALFARWEAAGDYRAVFVCSYRDITRRMAQAIRDGEFEDNPWMEGLDIEFAQLYFDAVDADESGSGDFPMCWKIALDRARQRKSTVIQDLILGMNAHINHDLAIALYRRGLAPAQRMLRERDHEKVNEVLAGMIDQIQEDISRRFSWALGFLDRFSGRTDELLTDIGIRTERRRAWNDAVALADAPNEAARDNLLKQLDEKASAKALLFAAPGSGFALPLRYLRLWDRALGRLLGF